MAAQMERFSQFFYTICSETGGIEGLLHSFFAFLLYKTDFYYEMQRPGEKQGFPPGYAEKLVQTVFKQYQQEYWKRNSRVDPKVYKANVDKLKALKEKEAKAKEAEA